MLGALEDQPHFVGADEDGSSDASHPGKTGRSAPYPTDTTKAAAARTFSPVLLNPSCGGFTAAIPHFAKVALSG